ncbi:MAG: 4-hydroxy-tetrahydrodipicolinate reductase [Deltaproteobacteria bacterium]|nr:4-hydroxy-tetrahydrodipicolinate reductase [Deltaproteobacteria bacterium]
MLRAIVLGAGGRMGGRIVATIAKTDGIELAFAVENEGDQSLGKDAGEIAGIGKNGVLIVSNLSSVIGAGDVVIDFTHHSASVKNVAIAADAGKPIIVGTTGFSAEELNSIKEATQRTKCVIAPNMSVGVNLMFKVLEMVAGILGDDYDVEIMEVHHNLKKDAPSGTAMRMAQVIANALQRDLEDAGVYQRRGMIGERTKKEIGIQTLRAGDIIGEHTVLFAGNSERLELTHRAHSRDNFARGAVRAAKWIINQENGMYDMQDVLGLK